MVTSCAQDVSSLLPVLYLSTVADLTITDPSFYEDGNPFYVWANQYKYPINESRVVQTARAFVNGYLYEYADTYGTVVSVNSTGSDSAIGNSLGPSDLCPAFAATSSGGNNVTDCEFADRTARSLN